MIARVARQFGDVGRMARRPALALDNGMIVSSADVSLSAGPIPVDWILEGNPVARYRTLFVSDDHTSSTVVWDCTAGVFNWHYTCDETIEIEEGEVVLTTGLETRRVGPGDVVHFRSGTHTLWRVDSYVRKVAFLRHPLPWPVGLFIRVLRRLQNGRPKSAIS